MRIKTLFAAILAAGLLFSGCRQDEDYVLPSLKVGTESLEFGQLSIEQVVEITASREWMVRNKPDWVAVDPASGPASATPQRVTLTVLDNTGYNRAGDVLFSIGLAKASVSVTQAGAKGEKSKGSGTLEDPYTPEGAREAAAALGADTESATDVYIKGKISRIDDKGTFTDGGTFGNASFYISEDGATGDGEFYCYRILYLGNKKFTSGTDIQVGDEVIVCGKIVNFRGNKPETVSGKAFLYSLNGTTEGGGGGQQNKEIFSQPFKTAGQGNFTIDNKTIPSELSYIWSYDDRFGMKASGYASDKNYDTESWLISPEIDLASATKPALSFKHAVNFFESVDKAKEEASVWVKAAGGEWTKLAGVAYPDKLSWSFVESGKIDLSVYAGKKIQIAFKYLSTSTKAGTWEVDEFLISE